MVHKEINQRLQGKKKYATVFLLKASNIHVPQNHSIIFFFSISRSQNDISRTVKISCFLDRKHNEEERKQRAPMGKKP